MEERRRGLGLQCRQDHPRPAAPALSSVYRLVAYRIWALPEGIAVLSKHDFLMKEANYVSSSHDVHSIDSRKVVMVQVNVPYMGLVNVFSAHLSWPSGGFFHQFERLRTWANQRHDDRVAATFLCGDFNIKAGSEAYQSIVRSGEYEDQYLAATGEKLVRKNLPQEVGEHRP